MGKDFDRWNEVKKETHRVSFDKYVHIREVWWCTLGVNIGSEADGNETLFERPVLILNKFNRDMVLVVPLSTTGKRTPYHFPFSYGDGEETAAVLSQLRLVSTKRLRRFMFHMPVRTFNEIRTAVQNMIGSGR